MDEGSIAWGTTDISQIDSFERNPRAASLASHYTYESKHYDTESFLQQELQHAPQHMLHFYKNGSTSDVDELIDAFTDMGKHTAIVFFILYFGALLVLLHRKGGNGTSSAAETGGIGASFKIGGDDLRVGEFRTAVPYSVHGIKHIAVIMDGNRRYGKTVASTGPIASSTTTQPPNNDGEAAVTGDKTRSSASALGNFLKSSPAALYGHKKGGDKLLEFIDWCIELGIPILTVYAFSTENWNRPKMEVDYLMGLFVSYFKKILSVSKEKGIVIRFVTSDPSLLPLDILELMFDVENETANYAAQDLEEGRKERRCKITVNVCVSYGSRSELLGACQRLSSSRNSAEQSGTGMAVSEEDLEGEMMVSLTELFLSKAALVQAKATGGDMICQRVHRHEARQLCNWTVSPDLILRTSGEQRLSNFLLYQAAYAEFFFVSQTWPEVDRNCLLDVVQEYLRRTRRFGK